MKTFFQIVGFRESNPQPQDPDPYSAQWAAVLLFAKTVKLASKTTHCTQLVMVELLNMFKTLLFAIVRKDISQAEGSRERDTKLGITSKSSGKHNNSFEISSASYAVEQPCQTVCVQLMIPHSIHQITRQVTRK